MAVSVDILCECPLGGSDVENGADICPLHPPQGLFKIGQDLLPVAENRRSIFFFQGPEDQYMRVIQCTAQILFTVAFIGFYGLKDLLGRRIVQDPAEDGDPGD